MNGGDDKRSRLHLGIGGNPVNISIKLDEVGKIGIVTIDGPYGESEHGIISGLIDQFVYSLALNGWTLLTASRSRGPSVIDRETVLMAMAKRAMREQTEDAPASPDQPAPQPPASNPDASPEERRTEMFKNWAGGKRPPDDPGESEQPETDPEPKDRP